MKSSFAPGLAGRAKVTFLQLASLAMCLSAPSAFGQLLMIRDDSTDTGAEPSSPPVAWESPDIWISQNSITGYRPVVFNTATPPAWYTTYLVALGSASDEEAEYRDPLGSNPNFIYVWVRNASPTTASTGNQVLRLYWARASTGLNWPANWERSFGAIGGCPVPTTWPGAYYNSDEITRPRKNAAKATATERLEYVQAVQEIANTADATVKFSDGVTYWAKQDHIHGTQGVPSHLNRRFLPWHREFVARYEILLQTRRPGLTLLYWDWTTNPRSAQNDPVSGTPFNFFTPAFMGQSGDGGMWGELIGAPFSAFYEPAQNCAMSRNEFYFNVVNGFLTTCGALAGVGGPAVNYTLPTPAVVRKTRVGLPTTFGVAPDATPLGKAKYWNSAVSGGGGSEQVTGDDFANNTVVAATGFAKTLEYSSHNSSHVYFGFQPSQNCAFDCNPAVGCQPCTFGNQVFPVAAAEDPFFFLLHANCDRLWARWQRNGGTDAARYNLDDAYDDIASAGFHTTPFSPWDGSSGIVPWTSTPGDYTFTKTPDHESILTPPVYDSPDFQPTAAVPTPANLDTGSRLRIPALGPLQSVILQIPWYPQKPLPCGSQPNHFCLLARIEETPVSPFGMTAGGVVPPEGPGIGANVVNNRRIAWRNISVLNNFPGFLLMLGGFSLRNPAEASALTSLRFVMPPRGSTSNLLSYGEVLVELGPNLYAAWDAGGFQGENVRPANESNTVQLLGPQAQLNNLLLDRGQTELLQAGVRLRRGYPSPGGTIHELQIVHVGTPGNPNAVVGGQTLKFDLNQLRLVARKSEWRFWAAATSPGTAWMSPNYDDSEWPTGQAPLGYGDPVTTTIPQVTPGTTYYRRGFRLDDVGLLQSLELKLRADDGAVVWLNGIEVARRNMSPGAVFHITPASLLVEGLPESVYFSLPIPNAQTILHNGMNLLAVEVHQHPDGKVDSTFDVELAANRTPANDPPAVQFVNLTGISYAQSGLPMSLLAQAVDAEDGIEAVLVRRGSNVFGLSATGTNNTYQGSLPGMTPGTYDLTLEAADTRGRRNQSYVTLRVLSNTPPEIAFTSPLNASSHPEGPVPLSVDVSDVSDTIARVVYSVSATPTWNPSLVYTVTNPTPPFSTIVSNLPPGHYLANAIAVDSRNGAGHAIPVHFHVHEVVPVRLSINLIGGQVQVSWDDPAAQLEASSVLGPQAPWGTVVGATSPFTFPAPAGSVFFRLRLGGHQH